MCSFSHRHPEVLIVGEDLYECYAPAWERGLAEIGVRARLWSYSGLWSPGFLGRVEKRFMIGLAIRRINAALRKAVEAYQPAVVLLYAALPILPRTVRALASRGWVSTYHNDNPFGKFGAKAYFRHFRNSLRYAQSHHVYRDQNVLDYRQLGVPRVKVLRSFYLPWADHPQTLAQDEAESFGHDIVFVGHAEPDLRVQCVEALVRGGFSLKIYGNRRYWKRVLSRSVYERLSPIAEVYGLAYRKVITASKVALCFLSAGNRDDYTRRVFEIPASKGLLLAQRTSLLRQLYTEGVEAMYFESAEELCRTCHALLENPGMRAALKDAGYRRCLSSGYDVYSRMRQWAGDVAEWLWDCGVPSWKQVAERLGGA